MAQYYIPYHFDTNEGLDILVSDGIFGLMNAKIQSRHSSGKQQKCWIRYSNEVVDGLYYCPLPVLKIPGSTILERIGDIINLRERERERERERV